IATQTAQDYFSLTIEGSFENGETVSGKGKAVVYTGYEWRAQLKLGDMKMRQVLAANASGDRLTGRMFLKEQELNGMQITAVRDDSTARINSVFPGHIQRAQKQTITITGSGLTRDVRLPPGITVDKIVSHDNTRLVLDLRASAKAPLGRADIGVGQASMVGALVVYNAVDSLAVEPAYAIARVGDNGGATPKVDAVFRAVGIDFGPDKTAGTNDDLQLGFMDGVNWSVAPWDAAAERDEDVKYAGSMGAGDGIFHPADAGPNPQRKQNTNNAGNLKVIAKLQHGGSEISGNGHLIVTVQRWNSPPLK
ncbi:MAG: quinohemoprotein amine dehydrogenase subunit alpha, partial [Halieaceae bacterium]|nr:quinohemoprotein amine dehydrogenase subunit alpha [Halieaceae bacterium]